MAATYCDAHDNKIIIYIHNDCAYIKYCCYQYYNNKYCKINKQCEYNEQKLNLKILQSMIVVDFKYQWLNTFLKYVCGEFKHLNDKCLNEIEYVYMQKKYKKMRNKYKKYYKLHNKLYLKDKLSFIDIV